MFMKYRKKRENKDYLLTFTKGHENWDVKICRGKFRGCVYRYEKVHVPSEEELDLEEIKNLPVSFEYVIIKKPFKALLDDSSRPKFEKLLFEILLSIMDDDILRKSSEETGEIDEVGNKDIVESSA